MNAQAIKQQAGKPIDGFSGLLFQRKERSGKSLLSARLLLKLAVGIEPAHEVKPPIFWWLILVGSIYIMISKTQDKIDLLFREALFLQLLYLFITSDGC